MTEAAAPRDSRLELTAQLRSRMLPLAVLLAATISIGAPMLFLIFGLHELRHQATTAAHRFARLAERQAREDHLLWKYNVPKLLGHQRAFKGATDLAAIQVLDVDGQRIEFASLGGDTGAPGFAPLWAVADISTGGRQVGSVWVAYDTERVYHRALLALGLFSALGLGLAWLVYSLPTRSASRAEGMISALVGRLRESSEELAEVNEDLERKVAERSEELSDACRALQDKEARLRKVSGEAIMLQEQERRAISRELHDAVGQALTAVRINLQLLEEGKGDAGALRAMANRSASLVDEALEEVRRAVTRLGPAILDEISLRRAIERQCLDFTERTSIPVSRHIAGIANELPPAFESTCYRIVQECLTNVVKHATATEVSVRLTSSDDALTLEVRDDGCGFDTDASTSAGRGLVGIRERVLLLGGQVGVDSSPGEGTAVTVILPRAG